MSTTSEDGLAAAYRQLLSLLIDAPDLPAFLDKVVTLAAHVITPAAACGVTVRRDGQPITVANSAPFAAEVDELQYGADEGPCLESMREGHPVEVFDLATDQRWPQYGPHALAHGVVSSLSLPLRVDGQTIGALNMYAERANAFDDTARRQAQAFADQCSAALSLTLRHADQAQVQQQLGAAMASRSIIDQAIGILMAQQRCAAGEAFDLLRQASQHRNRKLRDVAADIITNVTGGPPQQPNSFRATAGNGRS